MGAILATYSRTGTPVDDATIRSALHRVSQDGSTAHLYSDGPFAAGAIGSPTRAGRSEWGWLGACGVFFESGRDFDPGLDRPPPGRLVAGLEQALENEDAPLRQLRGEYSLFGWNPRSQRLIAARDHLGTQALLIYRSDDLVALSNDLRCLLLLPQVERSLDLKMLAAYLDRGLPNVGQHTFFHHIEKVPAGSLVVIGAEDEVLRSYWYPSLEEAPKKKRREVLADIRALLDESVRKRVAAGGRPAFCLSGGLDSSSMLVIADALRRSGRLEADQPLAGWTCRNRLVEWEETNAALVADAVGAEHYLVQPTAERLWSDLDLMIEAHGTPPIALGAFHQWLTVAGASSQGHDVLFDGNGADGILWGGRTVFYSYMARELKRGNLLEVVTQGGAYARKHRSSLLRDLRFLWRNAETSTSSLTPAALLDDEFLAKNGGSHRPRLQKDFRKYQVDHVLYDGDVPSLIRTCERNGTHHGVRTSFPYADPDLAEYAFRLPVGQRVHRGIPKALIREAVPEVPDEVRLAEKKIGLNSVDWRYYLEHPGEALMAGALEPDSPARPYIDQAAVREHFETWRRREPSVVGTAFFRVAMLDRWLRWLAGYRPGSVGLDRTA